METKTALVRRLAANIPRPVDGVPQYLLRVDLLPTTDAASLDPADLDACKLPLNYDQGYPCFSDGRPIWSRLFHESQDAYRAFEHYLTLGATAGLRQVSEVSTTLDIPSEDLMEWFHENFWLDRSNAYDLFRKQAHAALRTHRQMTTEDMQYVLAEKLLRRLSEIANSEEFIAQMRESPRLVIEGLKAASRLQLQAVGLHNPQGASKVEVNVSTHSARPTSAASGLIDRAMADPEAAELLQELVIRLETDGQTTKTAIGLRSAAA